MYFHRDLVIAAVTIYLINFITAANNPDVDLTTPQLINKYGYPVESHEVTTEDGYILTLHRIPYSSKSPAAANKPVVFLQHGLMCSSADWIILGPENSLGYLLADAGYDVWMGNARGNTYSKAHVSLDTSSYDFWNFSWHEMGVYDLPAEIDFVLEQTGQENLYYIGHSMGTTMFYVFLSMKPEYNSKIRYAINLAPISFMKHCQSTLVNFASYFPGGQIGMAALQLLGVGELMPSNELMQILSDNACAEGTLTQTVCSNILFLIVGYDPDQLNSTALPVILAHTPAGASTKSLAHYAQEIRSLVGGFRQWDYYALNLVNYGSLTPPEYNLEAITVPITLFYGDNDVFGDPEDVHELNDALPQSEEYEVALSTFNHMDFLWAKDVKVLVNDPVMSRLSSH